MTKVPEQVLADGEHVTMVRGEEGVKACRGFWFLPLVLLGVISSALEVY